jgi:hypothetical protein
VVAGGAIRYLSFTSSRGRLAEAGKLSLRSQAAMAGPCSSGYSYRLSYMDGWAGQDSVRGRSLPLLKCLPHSPE